MNGIASYILVGSNQSDALGWNFTDVNMPCAHLIGGAYGAHMYIIAIIIIHIHLVFCGQDYFHLAVPCMAAMVQVA